MTDTRLPQNCRHHNCPNDAFGGHYCDEHKKGRHYQKKRMREQYDPQQREYQAFYNSKRWRKLRRYILACKPFCAMCGRAATLVDHIIPIQAGGSRLEQENLQSLCHICHNVKTAEDFKRFKMK